MPITIKFVGAFRGVSGKEKFHLSLDRTMTLKEVVEKLAQKLPKLEHLLIDPELKDPRPNTLILVNGKEISVLEGLDTLLRSGDEIVFVPVVHGG
jgi:molybdopterin synthase sulfur carrier subunit